MNKKIFNITYKQLKKNWLLWFFTSLFILTPFIVFPIFGNFGLINSYSYIYFIVIFSLELIILFIFNLTIFGKNRQNGLDIGLESKSFSLFRVYSLRLFVILIYILIINLVNSITSGIMTSVFLNNGLFFLIYFLAIFFGLSLVSVFIGFILFFIFAKTQYITSIISSLILLFSILFTSLISHTILINTNKNNYLKFDTSSENSASLLTTINNDYSNKKNYLFIKENIGTNKFDLPTPNIGINFMFGEWIMQPMQAPFAWINNSSLDSYYNLNNSLDSNYKFSMTLNKVSNRYSVNYNNIFESENVFVYDPSLDNPLNYSSFDAPKAIANVISNKIISVKEFGLSDPTNITALKEKLDSSNSYEGHFSEQEILLLRLLFGINQDTRILYYLYKDYDFYKNYMISFEETLKNITSKEFSDFYVSILNDTLIYKRMFEYQNDIITNTELLALTSGNEILSESYKPKNKDINFFKNKFISFLNNNTTIGILKSDSSYATISVDSFNQQLNSTSPIQNKEQWDTYVDQNSLSLKNLMDLYKVLFAFTDNTGQQIPIYSYKFTPNIIELRNLYTYAIDIKKSTWIQYEYLFIIALIISILIMTICFYVQYRKY